MRAVVPRTSLIAYAAEPERSRSRDPVSTAFFAEQPSGGDFQPVVLVGGSRGTYQATHSFGNSCGGLGAMQRTAHNSTKTRSRGRAQQNAALTNGSALVSRQDSRAATDPRASEARAGRVTAEPRAANAKSGGRYPRHEPRAESSPAHRVTSLQSTAGSRHERAPPLVRSPKS